MAKICDMNTVREYAEGYPVELWRDDDSGRLVLLALNEAGFSGVRIDLWDLINWLRSGSGSSASLPTPRDTLSDTSENYQYGNDPSGY
jgi:hypothetical protein